MTQSPIHEPSAETVLLTQRLIAAKVGDLITYQELTGIIHKDVARHARGALDAARRAAMRETGAVFSVIVKIGLRRLDDAEIVATGHKTLSGIRRAARRGSFRLTRVRDFGALPKEKQTEHNQILASFGALAQFSDARKVAKLTIERPSTAALTVGETLKQFEKTEGIK